MLPISITCGIFWNLPDLAGYDRWPATAKSWLLPPLHGRTLIALLQLGTKLVRANCHAIAPALQTSYQSQVTSGHWNLRRAGSVDEMLSTVSSGSLGRASLSHARKQQNFPMRMIGHLASPRNSSYVQPLTLTRLQTVTE